MAEQDAAAVLNYLQSSRGHALKVGFVEKQPVDSPHLFWRWSKRYLEVYPHLLAWYDVSNTASGYLMLATCTVAVEVPHKIPVIDVISESGRRLRFRTFDERELQQWYAVISQCINDRRRELTQPAGGGSGGNGGGGGSGCSSRATTSRAPSPASSEDADDDRAKSRRLEHLSDYRMRSLEEVGMSHSLQSAGSFRAPPPLSPRGSLGAMSDGDDSGADDAVQAWVAQAQRRRMGSAHHSANRSSTVEEGANAHHSANRSSTVEEGVNAHHSANRSSTVEEGVNAHHSANRSSTVEEAANAHHSANRSSVVEKGVNANTPAKKPPKRVSFSSISWPALDPTSRGGGHGGGLQDTKGEGREPREQLGETAEAAHVDAVRHQGLMCRSSGEWSETVCVI
jgi:hypothetical protein